MNQPAQQPDDAAQAPQQPSFQVEKLYVKDLSLEVPNAPEVFMQPAQPELEIQVTNQGAQFAEGLYEVVVTVTVTALAEVAQAGIFSVRGVTPEDLDPLLGIGCPTILFPYVREAISGLVTRAGFPPVLLAPVSFEQIYLQRRQQAGQPQVEAARN